MFAWTTRPTANVGEPSPLLSYIAGEFAPRIAALWPAPHAVFLTAEAGRRHLLCLHLAQNSEAGPGAAIEAILHAPLRTAIGLALPRAPAGLRRALDRMGEAAWPRAAYIGLLEMLAHPQAAKALRHAGILTVEQIRSLTALPRPFLDAGGGRLGLDLEQARLTAELYQGLVQRDGETAASEACARWGRAATAPDALSLMRQDMTPPMPPAPFVGTARLRPLRTEADMRDAALRYRNCLRDQVHHAAYGASAFYEWMGEPRAIVEISRDRLFGWRLSQARLVDNDSVPEAAREAICAELTAMGVHVGRSDWELRHALDQAARPGARLQPARVALGYVFADEN